MAYGPEIATRVRLVTTDDPYGVPLDPLALSLSFTASAGDISLPWLLPSLVVAFTAPLGKASDSSGATRARLTAADPADDQRGTPWSRAQHKPSQAGLRHQDADHRDHQGGTTWNAATVFDSGAGTPWENADRTDSGKRNPWGMATTKDRPDYASTWIMKTAYRDAVPAMPWYSVNLTGTVYDDEAIRAPLRQDDPNAMVSLAGFGQPYTPRAWDALAFSFGYVPPKRPSVPHDVQTSITARQATARDNDQRIPWGAGSSVWLNVNLPYPVEDNPPPPDPADPPEKRTVYLTMNTLQITDTATGTPLEIRGVSISLDIDSLSWKFSGSLYGNGSLALVQPDSQGMKDIDVTINGHTWRFAIERYTSDERFPTMKYQLAGVSRTQYMAAPFAPVSSYTNGQGVTAAQAAAAVLQNTGFALDWDVTSSGTLPDWILPAGSLSYRDKAPAQVIGQIVSAAGGILVPSPDQDRWTVQARYKVMPWDWDGATVDALVYLGQVRSRSAQYEPGQAFNACYVSGTSQGVAVDVVRQGSGGTQPMPDIYDDLITDNQVAISRGKAELAAAGNKVIETLSVIIPEQAAAPGILTPGKIIKVIHDDPGLDYVALVTAISIAVEGAGGVAIYQNATLERIA